MKITENDIISIYGKMREKGKVKLFNHKYNKSIFYLTQAAITAAYFNWIYKDDELESLMLQLSKCIFSSSKIDYNADSNKCVFYDFRAADNCCLTQQYLRGLMKCNMEILYIPETLDEYYSKNIVKELNDYGKATILKPLSSDFVELIKYRRDAILNFSPNEIFVQIAPWSVSAVVLFYSLNFIKRYSLVINDHLFNVGANCFDYYIEWRNRGINVDIQKRNINMSQIIFLPYYPIVKSNDFEGFPGSVPNDKVLILSGGSFYKIYNEKNDFFNIIKSILLRNQNSYFIYVGNGSKEYLQKCIDDYGLQNRMIILPFRKDINEVIKRCDIYINTYPFSGGLMNQYAAINKKPILAYNTPQRVADYVEEIVCHNGNQKITFTSVDELLMEADKLINSEIYREKQGMLSYFNIMKEEDFNNKIQDIIDNKIVKFSFKQYDIDYDGIKNRYFERQNSGSVSFAYMFLRSFKLESFFVSPKLGILSINKLIKKIFSNKFNFGILKKFLSTYTK